MELEPLLQDLIKPELNKIYTEPPSSRGGGDMVFFCRGDVGAIHVSDVGAIHVSRVPESV